MAWAITAAAVSASLSVGASISANESIADTASANALATSKMLDQSYRVTSSQLQDKARELGNQYGMQLTKAQYQNLDNTAKTAVMMSNSGVFGQTAQRRMQENAIKEELTIDDIQQNYEAGLVDVQNEMRNAKYSYESGSMQNAIQFNNTMAQQQSGFEILAGATQSGLGAYGAMK